MHKNEIHSIYINNILRFVEEIKSSGGFSLAQASEMLDDQEDIQPIYESFMEQSSNKIDELKEYLERLFPIE